jgi:hypothetical protein
VRGGKVIAGQTVLDLLVELGRGPRLRHRRRSEDAPHLLSQAGTMPQTHHPQEVAQEMHLAALPTCPLEVPLDRRFQPAVGVCFTIEQIA